MSATIPMEKKSEIIFMKGNKMLHDGSLKFFLILMQNLKIRSGL